MTKMSKREYLIELKKKYRNAKRKQKTQLLNDFCEFAKYNRNYAIDLINKPLPPLWKRYKQRKKYYDLDVVDKLLILWRADDEICAERFQPFIPALLKKMIDCGEIHVSSKVTVAGQKAWFRFAGWRRGFLAETVGPFDTLESE